MHLIFFLPPEPTAYVVLLYLYSIHTAQIYLRSSRGIINLLTVGNLGKLTSNLIQKIKNTNITEAKETMFVTKTDLP
jgi:hypothetical protein